MKENKFEFQTFTKEVIDKQFQKLVDDINPTWDAKKIMAEMHKILVNRLMLASIYNEGSPSHTLYRVTMMYDEFNPNKKSCYSYPPAPKMGRANLKGFPVLYTSLDPLSAVAEMKGELKEGEWFYISKWSLNFPVKLHTHTLILNTESYKKGHILNELTVELNQKLKGMVKEIPMKFKDGFVHAVQKLGELYATPDKDLYHITSAYSHEILYGMREKNVFMPAIIYPAVENNQQSINFAMHPSLADSKMMKLEEVFRVSLKENKLKEEDGHIKLTIARRGIFKDDQLIKWEAPFFEIVELNFKEVQLYTYNESLFEGTEATSLKINNTDVTVENWIHTNVYKDEFQETLANYPIYEEVESPLSHESKLHNYVIIMEFDHGNEVITKKGGSCIKRVAIPITWVKEYRKISE